MFIVNPYDLAFIFTILQIAMWATELFFQFGGEPHFVFPTSGVYQSPQGAHASPQMMSPGMYSTPSTSYASPSVLGRAIMGPELVMSGRHQGLCLYLSRLIRYYSCYIYGLYLVTRARLYVVRFGMYQL